MGLILDEFICGDCLTVMREMSSGSIDLVVTSPPYNLRTSIAHSGTVSKGGKWKKPPLLDGYSDYADNLPYSEYVQWQSDCLSEMYRLIKDDGAIFYNHKWRIQGGLLQDHRDIVAKFPVRQIIIWNRKGGINFNRGYFLPTYEVIYLICKSGFQLTENACSIGDVWAVNPESGSDHPAPFPVELASMCIRATDARVILDPFMGSGTTALAAKMAGRNFIGIDISSSYCDMARRRLDMEIQFPLFER